MFTKYLWLYLTFLLIPYSCSSQKPITNSETSKSMSPELLWKVQRVSATGISKDGNYIIYKVTTPNIENNSFTSITKKVNVTSGKSEVISSISDYLDTDIISADGKYRLTHKAVKVHPVLGIDFYPKYSKSNVKIYDDLSHRHWDTWNEGFYNHVFYGEIGKDDSTYIDILDGLPYHCPQQPFGGTDDYVWHPDGKNIIYVSKKLVGTTAMLSTNTDIYSYNIENKTHKNLTPDNFGYDTHPLFSPSGDLAWLSMKVDGYEADKNDIKVMSKEGVVKNLTAHWDETVNSFIWSQDGKVIYFTAAIDGTQQVFSVDVTSAEKPPIKQITKGDWDVNSIIGVQGNTIYVTRVSHQRAAEIYSFDIKQQSWTQLTSENADLYNSIQSSRSERRYVTTSDGKKMLVWVVFPPNFDPKKKYPTLLYCQGGPQSALTQFYSYRWNLDLMASQGYIVVAPNRRGMPGHGVAWNEQISKDWGGQNIRDYLSAIDEVAKESYVDKTRLGAVGASYGGYSVFYLAGVHANRFKSFIAHCGIFNTQSMYGSTEEIFFVNYDLGGPYWENKNNKSYTEFNPANHVHKWNTPILIIQGGKDYRVPESQSFEAFTAAQLKGIKSRYLYFSEENHWIMKPQNGLVWQNEFFEWLQLTLQ